MHSRPTAAHTAMQPAPSLNTAAQLSSVAEHRSQPALLIPRQSTGVVLLPPPAAPELPSAPAAATTSSPVARPSLTGSVVPPLAAPSASGPNGGAPPVPAAPFASGSGALAGGFALPPSPPPAGTLPVPPAAASVVPEMAGGVPGPAELDAVAESGSPSLGALASPEPQAPSRTPQANPTPRSARLLWDDPYRAAGAVADALGS